MIQAIINSEVITSIQADENRYYQLNIPLKHYYDQHIYLKVNCDSYKNIKVPITIFGSPYSPGRKNINFGLKKVNE